MYKNNLNEETRPHYLDIMNKTIDNMEYLHNQWLKHEATFPEIFFQNGLSK